MGTEAGQPLDVILARKEAERELGAGVFFWGIGNALGPRLWRFIHSVPKPMVFFSPMRAKPKPVDVSPKQVVAWTAFFDREGSKHAMPQHTFVTSRAPSDKPAGRSHFALVCRKKGPLLNGESWAPICSRRLTNFHAKTRVAFSQVTAIVQVKTQNQPSERSYDVSFAADLVAPYYVRLADPVEVPRMILSEINNLPRTADFGANRWRSYLDERFAFREPLGPGQLGLFDCAKHFGQSTPRLLT